MKTIGFATEYFTLWDKRDESVYFTDSYGNQWLREIITHYSFIKNVSKDLAIVKSMFPDLVVDVDLKGKKGNWSLSRGQDLTPQILKFGKYSGKSIFDVSEIDFNYILWLIENAKPETKNVCLELPKVINYFSELEIKEELERNSHPAAESGQVEVTFFSNPNRNVEEELMWSDERINLLSSFSDKFFAEASIGEGNRINIIFDNVKFVGGMYPYKMAEINGRAMKTKGKKMLLNLNIIETKRDKYCCEQIALIR